MISPVENNGMVLRMQDFSSISHNQNNHAANVHMQLQDSIDKNGELNAHSVVSKDDSNKSDTHHDAKEEGKNKYYNNRKKSDNGSDKKDKVIAKSRSGFDISV